VAAGQGQQGAQRSGLGAGLDAVEHVRHAHQPKAAEEEEVKAKAKARSGVKPVSAKGGSRSGQSATAEWHDAIARRWQDCLHAHLPSGTGRVALLVWGDPALYDSTLRIASRLGLDSGQVQVVPGITSMQVLCSAHGIALNAIGAPFLVTTGRQLRENGWPQGVEGRFYMKVVDEGTYTLINLQGDTRTVVACKQGDYVPHGVVPGEYGDYVHLKINGHGVITNWPKSPRCEFW
jgi:siroheme synthase